MNLINAISEITEDKNCSIHITKNHITIHTAETMSDKVSIKRDTNFRHDLYAAILQWYDLKGIEQ